MYEQKRDSTTPKNNVELTQIAVMRAHLSTNMQTRKNCLRMKYSRLDRDVIFT